MTSSAPWFVMPWGAVVMPWAAVILALSTVSGCATIDKWKQEHREASLYRRQEAEAAAREQASWGDRPSKLKRAQDIARLRRLQSELIAHGDPDSLAAGALFEIPISGFPDGTALELATRAVARAPERTDLALLQLQLCENAPACDALPLEAHLRELDPENGITWTYALLRAAREDRPADWVAARDGLAQSQRIDLYWNRTVSHLAGAVAGRAGLDSGAAVREVIGIETALEASFQSVSKMCQAQAIQQPDVLVQCRRIAAAFQHGDTSLVEAYGSSLAIRLWPEGSAERLAVITERRALRYRADLMTRYAERINSPRSVEVLAGLLARYPTEQAAFRALFVRLGLNPDPPPGWVDRQPEG